MITDRWLAGNNKLYGHCRPMFISALIVPLFDALESYARRQGWRFQSRLELVRLPEVVDFIRQRIEAQSADLAPFERIRRFRLLSSDFTVDRGEITPTLKVRRNIVAARYRHLIDEMYA